MTALLSPVSIDDAINRAILAVSEDRIRGFEREPLATIAREAGLPQPLVVERLRAMRDPEEAEPVVLAATDPAQPYGAALPWPRRDGETTARARRVRGAYVVLAGAEPVVFVEKGGRGLQVLTAHADDPRVRPALEALAAFVTEGRAGRGTKLSLEKVDGEPVVGSPLEELLIELGFRPGPRKLTLSA